uniref:Uncharacterized protein n=1 Tax=Nelumbo nucifera TaxID=4432 RepID=A0A822YDU9_NELNU|nr:TPA_asm: hypothetical protein HUJ06_011185 [Nelumbo nucifera]
MDDADEGETPAGVVVDEKDREKLGFIEIEKMGDQHEETLYGVLHRLLADIFFPGSSAPASLLERTRASFRDNGPLLREASRNSSRNLLLWTRQGSPLCALLVIPVCIEWQFICFTFLNFVARSSLRYWASFLFCYYFILEFNFV